MEGDRVRPSDEEVVDALFAGARSGRVDPVVIGDNDDLERGVRLQLAVLDRWRLEGESVGGWKVGLTSREGRASMGSGFHPFGYILSSRIFTSGSAIPFGRLSVATLEPELCFEIAEPLIGPNIRPDRVAEAVATVAPAFEVKERRLPDGVSGAIRLADNLKQWGLVVGRGLPCSDRVLDPAAEVYESGCRSLQTETGEEIEDHFASIADLANSLHRHGLMLAAGQRVITGSLTAAHLVERPGRWVGHFPELGDVEFAFDSPGGATH